MGGAHEDLLRGLGGLAKPDGPTHQGWSGARWDLFPSPRPLPPVRESEEEAKSQPARQPPLRARTPRRASVSRAGELLRAAASGCPSSSPCGGCRSRRRRRFSCLSQPASQAAGGSYSRSERAAAAAAAACSACILPVSGRLQPGLPEKAERGGRGRESRPPSRCLPCPVTSPSRAGGGTGARETSSLGERYGSI